MSRKLLVTGFGPFPRMPRNPSARLAERVAADPRWRRLGIEARALILETSYAAIERDLIPAIRAFAPEAVLMLGVAGRRKRVAIEIRAANRVSRLMPDASGRVSESLAFRKGEPPFLRAAAPVRGMLRALRERGASAYASRDAGRYLCNASYFAALSEATRLQFSVVFIHIPKPREKAVPKTGGRERLPRSTRCGDGARRPIPVPDVLQRSISEATRVFSIARRRPPGTRKR